MRVFITGIDGMLGRALRMLHVRRGDEVTGCDIWPDTAPEMQCDIRDGVHLRNLILSFKPDRIYHAAAMLGVANTERYPELCTQINERGTENVGLVAAESGAELVFLSSSEVYGDQVGRLDEQSSLLGSNVYAKSKQYGERVVRSFGKQQKVTICRMFNCFGAFQVRQFFLPKIIHRAKQGEPIYLYGNPFNLRSYLDSTDAAYMIIQVADRKNAELLTVNVAHPTTVTLDYAAQFVVNHLNSGSPIKVQHSDSASYEDRAVSRDIPNRLADLTLLRTLTAHIPARFEDAVRLSCGLYNTQRADWTYSREVL